MALLCKHNVKISCLKISLYSLYTYTQLLIHTYIYIVVAAMMYFPVDKDPFLIIFPEKPIY